MSILLPKRWQRQPQQQSLEIDWSHPLARGLTGLWIFNNQNPINLVNGVKATATTKQYRASRQGKGLYSPSMQLAPTISSLINGNVGTFLYYGEGTEASSANWVLGGGTGSNFTGIFGSSSSQVLYSSWNNTATLLSGVAKSGFKKVVVTGNATNTRWYNNGALTNTSAAGGSTANNQPLYLGHSSGSAPAASYCNVAATWNRTLSDKEAAEASRNIYQILKPVSALRSLNEIFDRTLDVDVDLIAFLPDLTAYGDTVSSFAIDLPTPQSLIDGWTENVATINQDLILPQVEINVYREAVNFELNVNLTKVTPDVTVLGENFGEITINLPLLDPWSEGGSLADNPLSISMTLPKVTALITNIFLDVEVDITLPKITPNILVGGGITYDIDLALPSIQSGLLVGHGNRANVALELPALTVNAQIQPPSEIDLPVLVPQFTALHGVSGLVNLTLPSVEALISTYYQSIEIELPATAVAITSETGRLANVVMTLPSVEVAITTALALNIELPSATIEFNAVNGAIANVNMAIPAVEMDASIGGVINIDFPLIEVSATGQTGFTANVLLDMPSMTALMGGNEGLTLELPNLLSNIEQINGNIHAVSVELPALEASFTISRGLDITLPSVEALIGAAVGNNLAINVNIPALDSDLIIAKVFEIELPAPEINISLVTGRIASVDLVAPLLVADIDAVTEAADSGINIRLPLMTFFGTVSNGISAEIELVIPKMTANLATEGGLLSNITVNLEPIEANLTVRQNTIGVIDIDLPHPSIIIGTNALSRAKFYNRRTR